VFSFLSDLLRWFGHGRETLAWRVRTLVPRYPLGHVVHLQGEVVLLR